MYLQRIFSQPGLKPWTSDEMSHSLLLASALSWGEKKLKHSWKWVCYEKSCTVSLNLDCGVSLSKLFQVSQAQCPKLGVVQQRLSRKKTTNAHERIFIEDLGAWETLDIWPWLLGTVIRLLVVAAFTQKLHPACHGIGSTFCIQNHL